MLYQRVHRLFALPGLGRWCSGGVSSALKCRTRARTAIFSAIARGIALRGLLNAPPALAIPPTAARAKFSHASISGRRFSIDRNARTAASALSLIVCARAASTTSRPSGQVFTGPIAEGRPEPVWNHRATLGVTPTWLDAFHLIVHAPDGQLTTPCQIAACAGNRSGTLGRRAAVRAVGRA